MALTISLLLAVILINSAEAETSMLYKEWNYSLEKHVSANGEVNYKNWINDRDNLEKFLSNISRITATDYRAMSKNEKMALWINAYNALTIKLVLDHYPIKRQGLNFYPDNSIRQINGVWDKYKISVAGRKVSLSEIENAILRKEFKEPLIHFAINCASKSCPPMKNKAYFPNSLETQLKDSARQFVTNTTYNKIVPSERRIKISKIFEWYGMDFVSSSKQCCQKGLSVRDTAIVNFLKEYLPEKDKQFLDSNQFAIEFLPYDWALNERK
jgi:hypothetical protein